MSLKTFQFAIDNELVSSADCIVKRSTYKKISNLQLVFFSKEKTYEYIPGEEPVLMRGCEYVRAHKYLVQYYYLLDLFNRYLRIHKLTFIDSKAYSAFIIKKLRLPSNKHIQGWRVVSMALNGLHYNCRMLYPGYYNVLINGKVYEINERQLKALKLFEQLLKKLKDR